MLYLLRHGITDWNEQKKMQGHTDIPLNARGREMAQLASVKYSDIPFDICYCSPLSRAKETAKLVLSGRDIDIIIDDRLKEIGFGICEGESQNAGQYKDVLYKFFHEPAIYQAPEGAESFTDLFNRTGEFLREVAEPLESQGKRVLIVGHGAMNSSIVCRRRGLSLEHFWDAGIPQCELMEV